MPNKHLNLLISGNKAGSVVQDTSGRLLFDYLDDYSGPDVSLSMPRSNRSFGDKVVRPWLQGLLSDDRAVRRAIAREYGVSADNPFDLLRYVGLDCPGAVQLCTADGLDKMTNRNDLLEPIDSKQIRRRLEATEGSSPSWIARGEGWSLGGNQGKIALRKEDGSWYRCLGAAATTHILKPGISGMKSQALTEFACMKLANLCGLPAAEVEYCDFDGIPAIVVERYDRVRDADGMVMRIHQEDFCQALSIPPDKKYASDGGPGATSCISMLQSTQDAGRNTALFLQMLFFNCAIGAPDAHAKNYSLLHLGGSRVLLAPMYDVASALPYGLADGGQWKLAMSIGGENRLGRLRKSNIQKLAHDNGLDAEACLGMASSVISEVKKRATEMFELIQTIEGGDELRIRFESALEANCERLLQGIS